jgi:CrcB protein
MRAPSRSSTAAQFDALQERVGNGATGDGHPSWHVWQHWTGPGGSLSYHARLGAASRFHTTRLMQGRWGRRFPWGTLTANVLGSMLLGCLVGAGALLAVPDSLAVGLGVGFCGALTTYSSFSYDTLELIEQRRGAGACANVVLNMGGAMAAVVVGYTAGSSVATRLLV